MSGTAVRDNSEDDFESVQEALDAFRNGEIDADAVMREFGHIDGIERSIAVAKSKRINVKTRSDVSEVVTDGVNLDL